MVLVLVVASIVLLVTQLIQTGVLAASLPML